MKDNIIIQEVTKEIVDFCNPLQVYLVSYKTNSSGELKAFKVCVIVNDSCDEHKKLESSIAVRTDSPVPFDVIVYSISEWNSLLEDDCTFAYRIESSGELLYGQK